MNLVFGHDREVALWTADRIPHVSGFGMCTAIGVALDGELVAGVVFSDYNPVYSTMQVSVAATTPRSAQRGIIRGVLFYPFEQLGVYKLWSAIPMKNSRALRFSEGIGFKREATLAHHFGDDHAVITRMLRPYYERRYKVREHGNKLSVAAGAA